jgi:hypothetical protein
MTTQPHPNRNPSTQSAQAWGVRGRSPSGRGMGLHPHEKRHERVVHAAEHTTATAARSVPPGRDD